MDVNYKGFVLREVYDEMKMSALVGAINVALPA